MSELEKRHDDSLEMLGDPRDPKSLYSMLPEWIVDKARDIAPEDHLKTDSELGMSLPPAGKRNINRLRESFWIQHHFAQSAGRKINITQVYFGVCVLSEFRRYVGIPKVIAYILRPPANYEIAMRTALSRSVDVMADILEADNICPKTGKLDPKIADVQRRLFENLSDRVKGMPVQRTENLNYNKEVGPGETGGAVETKEQIDEKIRRLEEEMGGLKDVTPNEP